MKRHITTLLLALVILPLACRADQLAWISRADVEKVVGSIQQDILLKQKLGQPYYMILYCSRCDREYVKVWEVKKVVTVAIPGTDYFEMNVFGRCILRSSKEIREGQYQEPIQYEAVPKDESKWILQGVDLAYVYTPSPDDSFRCIGKKYKLECDVHVEKINLPKEALMKLK
ncbi:hypothetical protein P3T73_03495 [Kiritimatiellota bacterium B12222]|nr:hypothetical protein P3T73_03495 [Kiritimatiellota bacterium B12222]